MLLVSVSAAGYLGTGNDSSDHKKDFWEYTPGLTGIPTYYAGSDFGLFLYPNPANGRFEIALSLNNTNVNDDASVMVTNELGQVVFAEKLSVVKGVLRKEIQLKDASDGMYLVKVTINDRMYSGQINYQK